MIITDTSILKPGLKLIGAKTRIRNRLYPYFPYHAAYIEPFLGTGGVLIGKPKAKVEIVNDLNPQIINYYLTMQERPGNLWHSINRVLHTISSVPETHWKEMFLQWRDYLTEDVLQQPLLKRLNQATCAYFVNKTCFNGILRFNNKGKCNSSFGKTFKGRGFFTEEYFTQVFQRIKDVQFYHCDYKELFEKVKALNLSYPFVFTDPPYRDCQTVYNGIFFSDGDHQELKERLVNLKNMKWLLTINDDSFVRDLYQESLMVDNKVHYSCSQTAAGRGDKPELLITNYDLNKEKEFADAYLEGLAQHKRLIKTC